MKKYLKKYKTDSHRLRTWNYQNSGCYFVTICTQDKKSYFGSIFNGKVHLFRIGKIAQKFWLEIPTHFSNVVLDQFIVMPNHIHGIIQLSRVETGHDLSLQNSFGPQKDNLGVIVGSFKSAVKRWSNENSINFSWQRLYYDHIIRSEKGLNAIREYITDNPAKWQFDKENPNLIINLCK